MALADNTILLQEILSTVENLPEGNSSVSSNVSVPVTVIPIMVYATSNSSTASFAVSEVSSGIYKGRALIDVGYTSCNFNYSHYFTVTNIPQIFLENNTVAIEIVENTYTYETQKIVGSEVLSLVGEIKPTVEILTDISYNFSGFRVSWQNLCDDLTDLAGYSLGFDYAIDIELRTTNISGNKNNESNSAVDSAISIAITPIRPI